jgi:hypothetical protein
MEHLAVYAMANKPMLRYEYDEYGLRSELWTEVYVYLVRRSEKPVRARRRRRSATRAHRPPTP